MNLKCFFMLFGLSFICFQVEGHEAEGHQADVHQGTDISKYRLLPDGLSPTQQFHRTNTRGKIECGKHCSLAQNCKYFRYNAKYKICRLYTPQFLVAAQNSTSFQVYVAGTRCYELVKKRMTWGEAREYCKNKGGHLVYIKSEEKQREIIYLLQHTVTASAVHPWIGGFREFGDSSFVWTDGSTVSAGFEEWGDGQPDFMPGEECMHMHEYLNYKWNDAPCSNLYRSICEYELSN